jgi:peptidoglycan/LPS O-acetylase OafA/YrhL
LGDLPRHFRTDLRLDALLWGCLAALLLHDPKTRNAIRERMGRGWFAGLGCAALACIVVYSYLAGLWLAMLLPMLLLLTVLHPEWAVSRVLDLKPVRFVGRISYSLYLWQQLFLVPGWLPGSPLALPFPANLGLALGAAMLSYYCVERPCMAYGRALAARLRSGLKTADGFGVLQT